MKGSLLFWICIGIAAIISLVPIFFLIRRYKNPGSVFHKVNDVSPPFALTELTDMLKNGLISQEEFNKLKKSVIDDFSKLGENKRKMQ
jgi:hypothetical protein